MSVLSDVNVSLWWRSLSTGDYWSKLYVIIFHMSSMWDISIKTHAHSEVYNNHGMYSKPVYQLNQQQLNIW